MGLATPALRFIAREHARKAFQGSVLTLGRQCVYATWDDVRGLLREESVRIVDLPAELPTRTNIPSWIGTPNERFTSDEACFRALGFQEVLALDCSDFERADVVADLNRPVSEEWHARFDLIVDSGTLEHIFHVPQALANVAAMLRTGGRVLHIAPTNHFTNHGFYQFGPTLFADFYRVNEFAEVRIFLVEQASHRDVSAPWTVYELGQQQPCLMVSRGRLLTVAIAEKTSRSTGDRIPLQSYYANLFGGAPQPEPRIEPARSFIGRLKNCMPVSVRTWARNHLPGFDPHRRPWGLKRWARMR